MEFSSSQSLWVMVVGIGLIITGMVLVPMLCYAIDRSVAWGSPGWGTWVTVYNALKEYVRPICIIFGGVMFAGGLIGLAVANIPKKAAEPSIQQKLEQLANLREQGILSEAEFEEKKKELLSKL